MPSDRSLIYVTHIDQVMAAGVSAVLGSSPNFAVGTFVAARLYLQTLASSSRTISKARALHGTLPGPTPVVHRSL